MASPHNVEMNALVSVNKDRFVFLVLALANNTIPYLRDAYRIEGWFANFD
jgi:hypothetical protein